MVIRQLIQKDCTAENIAALNALMGQLSTTHRDVGIGEMGEVLQHKDIIVLIAEEQQVIVGSATVYFLWKPDGKLLAEIHDVVVDEGSRGHGIGTHLMEEAVRCVKERVRKINRPIKILFTSRPKNIVANLMYQKMGFELAAKAEGEHGTNLYRLTMAP